MLEDSAQIIGLVEDIWGLISNFGLALGFTADEVAAYKANGSKDTADKVAKKMLDDWHKRTPVDKKSAMRKSLRDAHMGVLADKYFPLT